MSDPKDLELQDTMELINQAREGRMEAYERLFQRYYARVRAVVHRRVGDRIRLDFESGDILQDAMIQAFLSLDRYEVQDNAAFIDWMGGIVENRIRAANRHVHAAKRDRAHEVAFEHIRTAVSSGSLRLEPSAGLLSPSGEAARKEEGRQMWAALEQLRDRYRRVIVLRHFEDASWDAVAESLDCPSPDAARMLYARATVELKKRLEES